MTDEEKINQMENQKLKAISLKASENDPKIETNDSTSLLLNLVNYPAMPFHHLIPAALLRFDSFLIREESSYQPANSSAGKQSYWQSLAARGISAREAALFDDSIECSFIELDGNRLIQIDWEALHYDALEGCAEIYLAEMFTFKRRIYEAGDELRNSLEFSGDDLASYLPEEIFTPQLVERAVDLFFDSLLANFTVTVSRAGDEPDKTRRGGKPFLFPDLFTSHITQGARRTNTWSGTERTENGEKTGFYIAVPANYWNDWQRSARRARFDFDFLSTLTDARAVRLYELTKLWRVPPNRQIDTEPVNQIPVPQKLEIEYEKFVSLMPLPALKSEREIKRQIEELIKPLRKSGYVKSFVIKDDWRGNSVRSARLVFRFND